MNTLSIGRAFQLGWLCAALVLSTNAIAQLQFIPSVWLRGWMNELAPGCVNGAGFLDPDHPALDTVHTAVCNTNTLDLTGIQYLHHLKNLTIQCNGAGVITPILPDSLESLTLLQFGFTEPITIPDGLRSLYAEWSGQFIGAIPPTLDTLLFHSYDGSQDLMVMPLPDGLTYLELVNSTQIVGLTAFPNSLRHLSLLTNTPLCLPALPPQMDHLEIGANTVHCLPNVPYIQDPDHFILPDFQYLQVCDPYDQCTYGNALGGSMWFDTDGDGLQGPSEAALAGDAVLVDALGMVGVLPGGDWMQFTTPGTHTVSAFPASPYATALTPAEQAATLSDTDPVTILPGFSYQFLPNITDAAIDITTWSIPSGQSTQLTMILRSLGSATISGLATVNVDPNLTISSISPAPLSVNGNAVTWAVADLQVGGQGTWTLTATVPAMVPGTMLTFTGHVTTDATDSDPTNNSCTWTNPVLASYDPNDKLVHPATATASEMVDGKELEYTIRFQNTGNYPATRVVISDTLSGDLVPTSMRYISSSHPCSWWLIDGVLTFRFDPIYLPDSSADLSGSQGFVKFRIATEPNLPIGHQIHNAAHIFFDINPPIHTPPVIFEVIDEQTGMEGHHAEGVRIGPNPASDQLSIRLDANWGSNARVSITDALGRRLVNPATPHSPVVLDLSGLAAGPLMISITNAEHHHVAKVMKH